ncbi:hypothetical protein [Bacillus cereus]|uniref:Uncharacterized protein n=1 Tax=Bacillus cereus VD184 TaxID=1053242 RepID=A0A9W5RAY4_BACCE|nr:hypothetical protein [Bacillus cereus]EOQ18620.1 hypothetical protein IKC_05121 [Bacillus cereus VD184]
MKPLHQLNIEEFRVRYDLTKEQVSEMLQLPVSKYESVTHKMLVHYSYHPEIKEFFMDDVEKDFKELCERHERHLCTVRKEIIENTLKCREGKPLDLLLYCSKKSASY